MFFFLVEERSEAGGPVQADRTSIFFWRQVNVRWCREFRSNSKNKVHRCEKFSVIFIGHVHKHYNFKIFCPCKRDLLTKSIFGYECSSNTRPDNNVSDVPCVARGGVIKNHSKNVITGLFVF